MSYIDTLPHIRMGSLAGYPLYRVTAEHKSGNERGHPDFSAGPRNLVMGGGSGEHPALVIHGFDPIVRLYLLQALDLRVERGEPKTPAREALEDELVAGLDLQFQLMFEFCGWGIEQFAQLARDVVEAPGLGTPYSVKEHTSVEHWLAYNLGELCVMQMPQLMSTTLARELTRHADAVKGLRSYWMDNVDYKR